MTLPNWLAAAIGAAALAFAIGFPIHQAFGEEAPFEGAPRVGPLRDLPFKLQFPERGVVACFDGKFKFEYGKGENNQATLFENKNPTAYGDFAEVLDWFLYKCKNEAGILFTS